MQKNSINRVFLIGHLGGGPEARYTKNGRPVASFSVATNESWKQQNGQTAEHTEWHSLVAWNKLAEFATEYLQKGQLVYIEGRIQTRTYNDKENIQRRITEIISTSITPLEWKNMRSMCVVYISKKRDHTV